jgi:hypothetical protein
MPKLSIEIIEIPPPVPYKENKGPLLVPKEKLTIPE